MEKSIHFIGNWKN